MTREERRAKDYLMHLLRSNGYPTYARILDKFDINYTSDPNTVAYMEPGKGRIVMNRGLEARQASVIVRHEILHEHLKHEMRLLNNLARKRGIDRKALEGIPLEDLDKELKKELYGDQTFNIAADYEISNKGYTDRDKRDVRGILINGRIVSGLVTEDQHPDWVDKTVEQMYDLLEEEREYQRNQPIPAVFIDDTTFLDPFTGVTYGK